MSAPAVGVGRPAVRIRGTSYPVLLPTLRDPRLHLAGVIVSLQVLGQVAFDFDLSIAQILVALGTAAALEVAIAFRAQRVLMWPASALLTGNGVAFVLRVPGTEHGDWWSMRGAWIFAATSAVALLSKYVIRVRGRHVFNPSNFGLVLCFLLLGPELADPLPFWWGPLDAALVLAIVLILAGGFAILRRLRLLEIAVGFWLAFAAGIGVLAASGHSMTAAWHVGPIEGADFWWLLVTSPEILVFLFFMITDPRTVPAGRPGRLAYAVGVGLLATLLIAPQTTEFGAKVAVLAALALACAANGVLALSGRGLLAALGARRPGRRALGAAAVAGAALYVGLVVAVGVPARPDGQPAHAGSSDALPDVTVVESSGIEAIDDATARTIARDLVAALRSEADALRRRDPERAAEGASGEWLAALWQRIRDAEGEIAVSPVDVERVELTVRPSEEQGPPIVVARVDGASGTRTVELVLDGGRYRIARSDGDAALATAPTATAAGALGGTSFTDVAREVGLEFRHGAFRFGVSNDPTAMMGGGLCWLDYDGDGWLDLFVVNSYAESDLLEYEARGGLPRTALYRNDRGRFVDVSARSGAALPIRGSGCVAADLDLDGHTDLYVTTAGYNVATDGYDALLWNRGDGTFTEGAREARLTAPGWHAGAAVGDVNRDGLPDLFVAGYTDENAPIPSSAAGFPTNHRAQRDLLYLNQGRDGEERPTFREVGRLAAIERTFVGHGLGAVLVDVDRDGRLDLYVANDADPNQLYRNVPVRGGLGFRLEEVGRRAGVDDPNAGMGVAAADYNRDGRPDLFVTNSRRQLHAAFRSVRARGPAYEDARRDLAAPFGTAGTGWGASWADLDLDGDLDLAVANGAIPIDDLGEDAQEVLVLENLGRGAGEPAFGARARALAGAPRVNGRGLAAADYDNDGDLDLAVSSIGGRLLLLESRGARGHWLQVELPSFAPGTVVTAVLADGRRLTREVLAGSSYLSSEDPRVHLGLGRAARVRELRVRFPDGRTVTRAQVRADRILAISR